MKGASLNCCVGRWSDRKLLIKDDQRRLIDLSKTYQAQGGFAALFAEKLCFSERMLDLCGYAAAKANKFGRDSGSRPQTRHSRTEYCAARRSIASPQIDGQSP